jgi:KDO2-lipid IV(A) lauroyltransferase
MNKILFYIFYGINWVITLLPLKVLYLLADLLYLILYYIIGYRRKVVATNLSNSFKGKSPVELKKIEKKFYRHLCDMLVEGLKLTHMNEKEIMRRMKMTNPEVFSDIYSKGKSAFLILGHYGNWEWLTAIPLFANEHKSVSIYKPLKNKNFDNLINKLRSSTGAKMVDMRNILREILENRSKNVPALYLSIADQTPPKGEIRYWTQFMNQETPFYNGTEKLAIKYNIPVYYLSITKIKRGYYTFVIEPICIESEKTDTDWITGQYAARLEKEILNRPEHYLWSHRRWKHKKSVEQ